MSAPLGNGCEGPAFISDIYHLHLPSILLRFSSTQLPSLSRSKRYEFANRLKGVWSSPPSILIITTTIIINNNINNNNNPHQHHYLSHLSLLCHHRFGMDLVGRKLTKGRLWYSLPRFPFSIRAFLIHSSIFHPPVV